MLALTKTAAKGALRVAVDEERYDFLLQWYGVHVGPLEKLPARLWRGPIYIHVPKTAGTSITQTPVWFVGGHKPLRFYERRIPKGVEMPVTFAVVRHPYARFASAFYYLRAGGRTAIDRAWARKNIPEGLDINGFAKRFLHRRRLLSWLHFRPQIDFVRSRYGGIGVDRILHFERLAEDWRRFAEENGLPPRLDARNVSGGGARAHDLTRHSRAILRRVYAHDFTAFGYADK